MHLLAAFRIQERWPKLSTPFPASSSMVCFWGWQPWSSSRAPIVSRPITLPVKTGVRTAMNFAQRARRISMTLAAAAALAFSSAAFAEDISESHLKAARAAVDAINATDQYDFILPSAAQTLK